MAKLIGAAGLVLVGAALLAGAFVGGVPERGAEQGTVVTTEQVSGEHASCCDSETPTTTRAPSEGSCCSAPQGAATTDGCCEDEPEPAKTASAEGDCCADV